MKKSKKTKISKLMFACCAIMVLVVANVASASAAYTLQPIPSPQPLDFSSVGEVWSFGASMMMDTIAIISNNALLVALVFALPLVGLGIGLFKRLIG